MKYLIESINIGETKSGEKNGKSYTYRRVGVKIGGKWYNASLFNNDAEKIRGMENKEIDLILYQEEYQDKKYDKFRFPRIEDKLNELITRIEKLEKYVLGSNEDIEEEPEEEPDDLPF